SLDSLVNAPSAMGTVRSAENMVAGLDTEHAKWQSEYDHLVATRSQLAQVLDDPFEHADELRHVETQARDLAAAMGLGEEDAEEAQAARKVPGQTLVDTFGDRVMMSYRNNDVVLYDTAITGWSLSMTSMVYSRT